jgi:two-component system sensor histidine kinase YesM
MVLAIIFEIYNLKHLEMISLQNLDRLCKNMAHQLDASVRPMVSITEFLLSDVKTLTAITTLAQAGRNGLNDIFISNAKDDIRHSLVTYHNRMNYYRVTFFDENGVIISSNFQVSTVPDGEANLSMTPYVGLAEEALGKPILIPSYNDPWNMKNPELVFGLARFIMGNDNRSYIEVQKTMKSLENIYSLNNADTFRVVVLNNRGDVFYSQLEEQDDKFLPELRRRIDPMTPITEIDGRFAASYYSTDTGTHTVVIQNRESTLREVYKITFATIIMTFCLWAGSVVVITLLARRMTAPVNRLMEHIESTGLHNIEHEVVLDYHDDEFAQLGQSYNDLLKRLNTARLQEQQMSLLHLQSEFDALQSQVNPHFLYNVLNVISHRGVRNGDEVICDICEHLAAMLRYSAGVSHRFVSVRQEINYLCDYLYLLKTRYHDELTYDFDLSPEVLDQRIPKIVLQQIVENCITHGFAKGSTGDSIGDNSGVLRVMNINVKGYTVDGHWYVEITDNGSGFNDEAKHSLEERMAGLADNLNEGKVKLDIGGMGLLSIYARLLIAFGDDAVFRIENTGGARVTVGATIMAAGADT